MTNTTSIILEVTTVDGEIYRSIPEEVAETELPIIKSAMAAEMQDPNGIITLKPPLPTNPALAGDLVLIPSRSIKIGKILGYYQK